MIDYASKEYIRRAQEKPLPGWFLTVSFFVGFVIGIAVVIAGFLS